MNSDQAPTAWQRAFRGFAPSLSTAGLEALATALATGDERLMTGATTQPAPLLCHYSWPVECACPVGFALWQGNHLETVEEVNEAFGRACMEADFVLGHPGAGGYFLNFVDDNPWAWVKVLLEDEVRALLAERQMPARAA